MKALYNYINEQLEGDTLLVEGVDFNNIDFKEVIQLMKTDKSQGGVEGMPEDFESFLSASKEFKAAEKSGNVEGASMMAAKNLLAAQCKSSDDPKKSLSDVIEFLNGIVQNSDPDKPENKKKEKIATFLVQFTPYSKTFKSALLLRDSKFMKELRQGFYKAMNEFTKMSKTIK